MTPTVTRAALPASVWLPSPAALHVSRDDLHVWRVHIDAVSADPQRLAALLSADEQARAARCRFEDVRRRFTHTRALLRCLLARYLDADPRQLQFRYGPRGKPELAERSGAPALSFSLAHSYGMALFAVACGRAVGIDVERIRHGVACDALAARFFTAGEAARLQTLPEMTRRRAFFVEWARKEAVIKGTGDGLRRGLSSFEVVGSVTTIDGRDWYVEDLEPDGDYAAAVAVEGKGGEMTCYQLDEENHVG